METDRLHRSNSSSTIATASTTTLTSELFICFTSRLSSSNHSIASSMKLPTSKSILSPGRPRDPSSQISLSTSLSRRLRANGSLKGGQASPMFPPQGSSTGKKRGCAFENPEPSSPKVTCIGQVRVKSKKQGRRISKRRGGGEVSFRNNRSFAGGEEGEEVVQCCASRGNGKWVHLPLTICEGLRAFGSEFNCFIPCRSGSCMAGGQSREEKPAGDVAGGRVGGGNSNNHGFCGAVFTRWLVAVEDGEGKGREIELVVGGEERRGDHDKEIRGEDGDEGFLERGRSYRRHVFEEIEFKEEKLVGGGNEEEVGRVNICIPPKNALLLMRCRSDPVKMAALANKFFEAPLPCKDEEEKEEEEAEAETGDKGNEEEEEEQGERQEVELVSEVGQGKVELVLEVMESEKLISFEANEEVQNLGEEKEAISLVSLVREEESQEISPKSISQVLQEEEDEEEEIDQGGMTQEGALSSDSLLHEETALDPDEVIQQAQENSPGNEEDKEEENELIGEVEETQVALTQEEEEKEMTLEGKEEDPGPENAEMGLEETARQPVTEQPMLPDCLLLMMCEPKLSMEVSKETWVCSTDFIRWLPGGRSKQQHPVKKSDGGDDADKKKRTDLMPPTVAVQNYNSSGNNKNNKENNNNNEKVQFQPPRSSCHYPAQPPVKGGESMAAGIEKKLVGGKAGYEPFVLTRCKSEPMRTAAAKLVPQDACFWKNRKLEQAAATLGVGAAGVGF